MTLTAPASRDPLRFLRELLEEDRRDGVDLSPEDFAQRLHLVVKETGCGRLWRNAILDTYPVWMAAYRGESAGAPLSLDLLDDEGERAALDDPGGL